ncbi:MAG: hypothetical protein IPO63_03920 [Bacteroidetes bacterium]|nr:hypothetical protein [Bacteroidota bacterium]
MMNKIIATIILLITITQSSYSQQNDYRTCDTDVMWLEALKNDPSAAERNAQLRAFRKLFIDSRAAEKGISSTGVISYRIPVVFHVIHRYGTENINQSTNFGWGGVDEFEFSKIE